MRGGCGYVCFDVSWFLHGVLQCAFLRVCVCVVVVLCVCGISGCRSQCDGCMNVAWGSFWGGNRSAKHVFFRVKWLQPAMKGSLCARRLRVRLF